LEEIKTLHAHARALFVMYQLDLNISMTIRVEC
jgi:hypothetical protein